MTGFNSKQRMAADKMQEPWNEDEWRRNNWRCGHGWLRGEQCEICNAPQPAQEPVAFDSFLESQDFYELMQTYRHCPIDAHIPFEEVKYALRATLKERNS